MHALVLTGPGQAAGLSLPIVVVTPFNTPLAPYSFVDLHVPDVFLVTARMHTVLESACVAKVASDKTSAGKRAKYPLQKCLAWPHKQQCSLQVPGRSVIL